ncbi:hypothetical protein R5W23_004807 [Gemmata sp. JC673]|uniref:Glycosyltransferase RgtA/B/C/D-like domain-containing protein n=1 Tax=Gemmata algarum TaxID=2975278 RepID=A0ABU5F934_9BACT|nr:hypothetical protein [Gemmata algarum]MDY3563307.1 hypothetical protein [Gemmata algarum]
MAMLLSVALFVGWTAVGLVALNAGRFRGPVRKLLIAPTVGFALFGIGALIGVRTGVPVGRSGAALGCAALALALVGLVRSGVTRARVAAHAKRFAPFAAVIAATFLLTGWPLLRYGFDWVANGNDDMANYCLGATGFRDHGFLHVPTPEELTGGQDGTQAAWFIYFDPETLTQNRCGSELTLALVSVWTGLTPQQAFMPVILALNAALVAATAALVLLGIRRRSAALAAAALLAVSSQTGYGVVQQLIGQSGGLALLCVSVALVSSPFRKLTRGLIARRAAVCGVVFGGLIVFYPEVVPFLVGACVLLGVRDIVRRRLDVRHLSHAAAAITVMAVLLPVYLVGAARFLLGQASHGAEAKAHTIEIFPYFMTPRGASLVVGLLPSYWDVPEPRQSASMAAGLVLLAGAALVALAQFRRGRPFAAVLLVMFALGAALYTQQAAFGLFKLAMFAQPFLWATVAAWAVTRRRRWALLGAAAVLAVVGGLNADTQYGYVRQSTGHDPRVDLPAVTQQRLLSRFHAEAGPRLASGEAARVLVASENNVLVKLLAAELRQVPNTQLAMAPFHRLLAPEEAARWNARPAHDRAGLRAQDAMSFDPGLPWVRDPDTGRPLHQLLGAPADWTHDSPERVLVVAGVGQLSVLNRQRYPESGPALLCAPLSEVRNFAVFRDATNARQNFLGMSTVDRVALFLLEADPEFGRRSMAGVGRHLVVDVLNPSPRVRVLVDLTTAYRAHPERGVPPVEVVGDRRVPVGAVGVGAMRLVSPPLSPQAVGNAHALVLDFNTEPVRSPNRLHGFEALWGRELPRDRRPLTASARNVSVVGEEEYAAFRPPAAVSRFPEDLAHEHLEFSGVYESGWAGKVFKFRLTQPEPEHEAVLRGDIPQTAGAAEFRTEVTVLVDGRPVETRTLGTGPFELRAPGGAHAGPRWVEYRFSHDQEMLPPDTRRLVAQVRSVGFEPRDERRSRPPERLAAFPADLGHPKLDQTGVFLDGWTAATCRARLHAAAGSDLVLRGRVPDFAGPGFTTEMTLLLDGREVARRELTAGDFEVRVPGAGGSAAGPRAVECRFSRPVALPAPDVRTAGVLLKSLGFEAAR